MTKAKQLSITAAVILLALTARIAAALAQPDFRGDWFVYSLVAKNIIHGCGVSLSQLSSAECVAHFGGNGLPGYPFFIASVWTIFNSTSPVLVTVSQAVVVAFSIGYVVYTIMQQTKDALCGVMAGLVLAISLPLIYWGKTGMAETLVCAMEMIILAELIIGIHQKKINLLRVALAIAVGLFLRLDFIFFLPAVAVAFFYIFPVRSALRQGVVITCLLCIPLGAWTIRNHVVQLPSLLPPAKGWMLPNGTIGPLGYLAWLKTWVVSDKERADAMYFWVDDYARIRIPQHALEGPTGTKASELLDRLRASSGAPVAPELDAAFLELARVNLESMTAWQRVSLFVRQCAGLWARWFDPFIAGNSTTSTPSPDKVFSPTAAYQAFVAAAFLLVLIFVAFGRPSAPLRLLTIMSLTFIATKTLGSVPSLFIENRYTVVVLPVLELTIAFALAQLMGRRSFWRRPEIDPPVRAVPVSKS